MVFYTILQRNQISAHQQKKNPLVARYQAENLSPISALTRVPKSIALHMIKLHTQTMTDSVMLSAAGVYQNETEKLVKEKKIEILQKVNCTVSASLLQE